MINLFPRTLLLFLLSLFGTGACGQTTLNSDGQIVHPVFTTQSLRIGDQEIVVEIARTASERQKGLSGRQSLAADQGMLFIYKRSRILHFTMRLTNFPLDIAFINSEGIITEIRAMYAKSTESYSSKLPSQFALEMNYGWFDKAGITPGQKIDLSGIFAE